MKRMSIGMSILASALVSHHASAQSSVTLYGILDTGLLYAHNVAGQSNRLSLSSGNFLGDRWGLKGSEDLGGGLQAIFTLENGFNIDNGTLGQGNREFGRQAFVGLANSNYGAVTLGRQYDPTVDLIEPLQGNWFMEYFSTPGDIDNTQNSARFNNSVKYASPEWSGFRTEVLYGFGGVAGSTGSGQAYSGALAYTRGPLGVAAGYFRFDNGNASLSTRGTSSVDTLFYTSVNSHYATASSISSARIAAKYEIDAVTVGGFYSYTKYSADASSVFKQDEKYNSFNVYSLWKITPFAFAEVGYNYLKTAGDSSAKYHQFTLAGDYFLSKRTDIYLSVGYTHATGKNGLGNAQAVIGPSDIDSGKSTQELVMLGIKHKF
ncbi:Outer membrane protein (porin) [Burkholderia sp. D7]|nr:Outer membrane protein (porin) [Burkholderia sp. D7]